MTIEDETGIANLVVRSQVYERWYKDIRHSNTIIAWGKVERQGQVVHVLVNRVSTMVRLVKANGAKVVSRDFH
jgi:error-prone DNA polymerase